MTRFARRCNSKGTVKNDHARPLDGSEEPRSGGEGIPSSPPGDARPEGAASPKAPRARGRSHGKGRRNAETASDRPDEAQGRPRSRAETPKDLGPGLPFDEVGSSAGAASGGAAGGDQGNGQAEEGQGKKSRSRRRRQRRNEAKKQADTGGEGQALQPSLGAELLPPRGDGRRPQPQGQRPKGERRDGRQAGQARADRPRIKEAGRDTGSAPRQGRDSGQRQQREGGQKERGPRDPSRLQSAQRDRAPREGGNPPRQAREGGYRERQGRGDGQPREHFQARRDEGFARREPAPRRRDEGFAPRDHGQRAARSGFIDSVLPPPDVIASLEGGDYQPPSPLRTNGRGKPAPGVRVLETLAPSTESLVILTTLEAAIEEAAPLQGKHRAGLKGDIRALWEELTSERESRSVDYLGTPPALSAYLRYFLPWNVFRLSSIFSNSDFCLPDKAVIVDIGSGPLTLPIALYASRPELRDVPLTFYCMDRVERVLEAGQAIFETLCMRTEGRLPPWRIELKKEGFGGALPEKAHLVAAANVFNEFFWKDKRPLGERALETARSLLSYLRETGSLFVMEPGDPRSGAFITALRAAVASEGASPLGPCPHALACPMPGIFRHLLPPDETRVVKGDPNVAPSRFVLPAVNMPKKRDKFPWCHYGVDTDSAPAWLLALSEEAGLPKDRAVFSYLWAARGAMARPFAGLPETGHTTERERRARAGRGILVRVVSEPFPLPDGSTGQYSCCNLGYTLLRRPRGEEAFEPGDLLEVTTAPLTRNDEKSGAIILPT
jgi:hypothetical protein